MLNTTSRRLNSLAVLALGLWFLAGPFSLPLAQAQNSGETQPDDWPNQLFNEINEVMVDLDDELQTQGERFRVSIFESLTDIDGALWEDQQGELELQVRRRVFDNNDILDSHTVIDHFRLPLKLTYPLNSALDISSQYSNVKVKFKTTLSLNATNIRQVYPDGLDNLPSLQSLEQQGREALNKEEKVRPTAPGDRTNNNDYDDDDDLFDSIGKILSWDIQNPLFKARYNNLLNLLSHPFRLPITSYGLDQMNKGEISRYTLSGAVQLSAAVGWSGLDFKGAKISGDENNFGIQASTYLKGNFNIAVMKEKKDQALLKLTKKSGNGQSLSFGMNSPDHQIFEGYVVLGQEILELEESVVPFKIKVSDDDIDTFDVGYRYDLNHPKAKEAYFKAAYGKLKLSEKLAQQNEGVEKVFTRNEEEEQVNKRYRMELSLFLERYHQNSKRVSEARITIDGEKHHIFQAHNINQRGHSTAWNDAENRRYEFKTTIDAEDSYDKGMYLRLESSITDHFTTGRELMSYIHEAEIMTGQTDIFPRVPPQSPIITCNDFDFSPWKSRARRRDLRGSFSPKCEVIRNNTSYGETHFYYRLGLSESQIRKFINIQEKKMWSILESAFGIGEGDWSDFASRFAYVLKNSYATLLNGPLLIIDKHLDSGGDFLQARRFYENWLELKKIKEPEKLAKNFSEMLDSSFHNFSLMKVFKFALPGEEFSYELRASSDRLFGHINKQGGVIDDLNTISDRAHEFIEFDRSGPRTDVDSKANIKSFNVDIEDKNTVKLKFNLPTKPDFIYFRVDRSSSWKFFKNLTRFIVKNKGRFKEGKNVVTIKRGGNDELSKLLSKHIFNDEWVTVSTAISRNGQDWGSVINEKFKVHIDEKEVTTKKEEKSKSNDGDHSTLKSRCPHFHCN